MQISTPMTGVMPIGASQVNQAANKPVPADPSGTSRPDRDTVNLNSSVSTKYTSPEAVVKNFDAETVIKNVASFIQRSMAMAKANGATEGELTRIREQSLAGMERGIKDAAGIIDGLGLMSGELTDILANTKAAIREMVESGQAAESMRADQVKSVQAAGKQVNNDFSFTLKTKEGDVITINAAQMKSSSMAVAQGNSGGAQALAAVWESNSSQAFSFTVQGDLSSEELKAIESLLKDIGRIADKFFSGKYEQAFEKAKSLKLDSNTLASMSMNMTQTKAVSQYSAVSSGSDWMAPIREYGQALAEAQKRDPQFLMKPAWLDALSAHPKQKSAMLDFARSIMPMMRT